MNHSQLSMTGDTGHTVKFPQYPAVQNITIAALGSMDTSMF